MCRTKAYDIWNMDTNLWDDIEKMFQVEVGTGVGVFEDWFSFYIFLHCLGLYHRHV